MFTPEATEGKEGHRAKRSRTALHLRLTDWNRLAAIQSPVSSKRPALYCRPLLALCVPPLIVATIGLIDDALSDSSPLQRQSEIPATCHPIPQSNRKRTSMKSMKLTALPDVLTWKNQPETLETNGVNTLSMAAGPQDRLVLRSGRKEAQQQCACRLVFAARRELPAVGQGDGRLQLDV